MDFLEKLMGADGCTAEGAASASNPLGQVVDALLPLQQDLDFEAAFGAVGQTPADHDAYGASDAAVPQDLERLGEEIFAREMAARDAWVQAFQHGARVGPEAAPDAAMRQGAWDESAEEVWAEEAKASGTAALEAAWQGEAAEPEQGLEQVWGESGEGLQAAWEAVGPGGLDRAWDEAKGDAEAAWTEAGVEDAFGPSQAGLDAAWARTQDRLEALASDAYELGDMNEFDAMEDPFSAGLELFQAGQLGRAVEAFEAAVRQDPNDPRAWRMLGVTHAENEEDVRAIQCLERAVSADPYHLEALVALGVSYVNEMNPVKALANLKAWLEAHPKFAALDVAHDEYSDGSLMDEVQSLMLQAAAHDPGDADVQVVLGVVYNVTQDFSAAAAAFRSALAARPEDYSLHNKLGATLANADQSEEGLAAYEKAIALKPRYARAWLNMGISHSNLSQEEDAARCFLQALALNPNARHIWPFLRIVFTNMGRYDLVERAGREQVAEFQEEFALTMER